MRLAIIDLGTNSVRFDVHELGADHQIYRLHREKLMIRLGEGVFLKNRLDPKVSRICVDAFRSFNRTIEEFHVDRVVAFGTAALREAKDADRFIRMLHRKCGIKVEIISGEEEARLIARGVLAREQDLRGNFALVDIGGGSTEITVCSGRRILKSASFSLGTARMQQLYLKTHPPQIDPKTQRQPSIEALRRHIRGVLLFKLVSEEWPKVSRIVGSSGTIRALAKICKKKSGEDFFKPKELEGLIAEMRMRDRTELLRIPGMESRRSDMILSGAILLQECMYALHAERVQPTEYSLRDGILDEEIEKLQNRKSALLQNPLKDLFKTACDLGARPEELKQALRISEELFDKLKPVHRLKPEWKVYLMAASLLHNTGRTISPIDAEAHSAYIARYSDTPYFELWESKLLEELTFHCVNGKISKADMPFKKDRMLRMAFLKLLAMLRIAAPLSFQRAQPIVIDKIKVQGKSVRILISKRYSPELAVLRADQRRALFEETFRKQLSLEFS